MPAGQAPARAIFNLKNSCVGGQVGRPSDFIVFADESGDHGLVQINPDYPVFVLSCCVFHRGEYIDRVCPGLQRFKMRWWLHDAVVLHSSQIKRQEPPFSFLKSQSKRELFMDDLTATIGAAPFTLIAGAIHKERLRQRYAVPDSPYSLALKFCMERVHAFLRDHDQADRPIPFLVEKRGKAADAALELVFRRVCDGDNRWGMFPNFSIEFVDKKANLPGLQIADLVSTPIGRYVYRPDRQNRAFDMVRTKFRCAPDGESKGWGFKMFP